MLASCRSGRKRASRSRSSARWPGAAQFDVQKLAGQRLHTRTIIRDRRQAFIGSQSLRAAELDSRRELGLIVRDAKSGEDADRDLRIRLDLHEREEGAPTPEGDRTVSRGRGGRSEGTPKDEKAVQVLTKELDPLAVSVKKAVRKAVAKAGEDVLHDKDVKDTMKKGGQEGGEGSRQGSGPGGPRRQGLPRSRRAHRKRRLRHVRHPPPRQTHWRRQRVSIRATS